MRNFFETLTALIVVLVLLSLLVWGLRSHIKNALLAEYYEKQERLERNIAALSDSIRVVVRNDREITYQIRSLEGTKEDVEELLQRPDLSDAQRRWLQEIRGVKGLVSLVSARVSKMDSVLALLDLDTVNGVVDAGDSIVVAKGTLLSFNEPDTTDPMQWSAMVRIDNPVTLGLSYKYVLDLQVQHKRADDGSVMLDFTSSDTALDVSRLSGYVVPPSKQRTATERWIHDNRRWLYPVAAGGIFVTGVSVGAR